MNLFKQSLTAFRFLLLIMLVTGVIYPAIVTGIAQFIFPWQANGSLIENEKGLIGSELIGQAFSSTDYFWGRPSATPLFPYNALMSSGSNLSPSNLYLLDRVKERVIMLEQSDPQNQDAIPVDLVTTSASGLDPEISPAAALYQVHRIAKARHAKENDLKLLILNKMEKRTGRILGEPRVNVLALNLMLDNLYPKRNIPVREKKKK